MPTPDAYALGVDLARLRLWLLARCAASTTPGSASFNGDVRVQFPTRDEVVALALNPVRPSGVYLSWASAGAVVQRYWAIPGTDAASDLTRRHYATPLIATQDPLTAALAAVRDDEPRDPTLAT